MQTQKSRALHLVLECAALSGFAGFAELTSDELTSAELK